MRNFTIKNSPIIIHIAVWMMIIGVPTLLSFNSNYQVDYKGFSRLLLSVSSLMVVFYLNYSLLIKQLLFTNKTTLFIAVNALLIGCMVVLNIYSHNIFFEELPKPAHHVGRDIRLFVVEPISNILVIMAAVAIRVTARLRQSELEKKEIARSNSEAELQNLKSQLNPHFLFNTLNNLYSLIYIDSEKAQEVVHELSQLLRYVLYDSSKPTVSLKEEVEFVANYIELMRIRQPQHVTIEVSLPQHPSSRQIAPLLFISPIENAFKHGVSNDKPSFIRITITEEEKTITCSIENSYFPKSSQSDRSGSGIGIANLRKRLAMIYPQQHHFATGIQNNSYTTLLTIQNLPT